MIEEGTIPVEPEKKDEGSWFAVLAGAIIIGIILVLGIILTALATHAVVEIFSWAWDLIG